MSDPLIHPDCEAVESELMGWLDRIAVEAEEAGADPDAIAHCLRREAKRFE